MQTWPYILVVDDDAEIRNLLGRYLGSQQFRIGLEPDKRGLLRALGKETVDLLVLDVLLPDGSGLDICRELRASGSTVPIILLTALKEEVDRIIGLEIGADDYLGKPFNPRELVARIRAVLRRHTETPKQLEIRSFQFSGFTVEPDTRQVRTPNNGHVDLTGAEFELLHALLLRPGRILSRDQLLDLTQGHGANALDRSVDVLVSRLRRKLGDNGGSDIIKTVRNGGYQFTARVETVGAGP